MPMSVRNTFRSLAQIAGLACALTQPASGQSLTPDGTEFAIVGSYLGDQVFPAASYSGNRGFVVWEDNHADNHGISVVARQLSSGFSPDLSSAFRVNTSVDGNQERPRVALLGGSNVMFGWHGGKPSKARVYIRLLNPSGAFYAGQLAISAEGVDARDCALAALKSGDGVIAWTEMASDGDLSGVFLRTISGDGKSLGPVVQVNQFTPFNQRNPEVTPLADGRFVVVWVSEQQRSIATTAKGFASCDIYARIFGPTGQALGNEFRINADDRICSNPVLTQTANGGFAVVWNQRSPIGTNGWDIVGSWHLPDATRVRAPLIVNSTLAGDQLLPSVASLGDNEMVSWISSPFFASRTSIAAQMCRAGLKVGAELKVNSWGAGKQNQPLVIADSADRFAVIWSSFVGARGYDLHAQRYAMSGGLVQLDAPFVAGLSQDGLQATWPPVLGHALSTYEVSVDNGPAIGVSSSAYTQRGFQPSSLHEFRVRYVLKAGDMSPWSKPGKGQTWGEDNNFDGLPDDWQEMFWGPDPAQWPSATADSDGDGATNAREYFAGTDPTNAKSLLSQKITHRGQNLKLEWNTIPGFIYQVQSSDSLAPVVWANLGEMRFARSSSDSVSITRDGRAALYRVVRIR